jgi:hypothetical protein
MMEFLFNFCNKLESIFTAFRTKHYDGGLNRCIDCLKNLKNYTLRRLCPNCRNWSVAKWQFSCSDLQWEQELGFFHTNIYLTKFRNTKTQKFISSCWLTIIHFLDKAIWVGNLSNNNLHPKMTTLEGTPFT